MVITFVLEFTNTTINRDFFEYEFRRERNINGVYDEDTTNKRTCVRAVFVVTDSAVGICT